MSPARRSSSSRSRPPWERWSDADLLDLRISDLGLTLAGTWLESAVHRLHDELADRGLRFRPHAWLSSEWFSPKGVPGIAVPFYLAHPRLVRLERSQMGEVEGGTRSECQRILRHEAGHALQQAYQLHRRPRWQRAFGKTSAAYPEYYRPNPASKRFVQHLRMYYAQSHPDEDFAETFAVWLAPRSRWRNRYAGWPALAKLEYVDELMDDICQRAARVRCRRHVDPVSSLRMTLGEHYAERHERYGSSAPDVYDRELQALFAGRRSRRGEAASTFLRRNRATLRRLALRWTGEYQFTMDHVFDDMLSRCKELGLRAVGEHDELCMEFAMLLAVHTVRSHYNRPDWVAL